MIEFTKRERKALLAWLACPDTVQWATLRADVYDTAKRAIAKLMVALQEDDDEGKGLSDQS